MFMKNKRWVSFDTSLGINAFGTPTVDVFFSYCDKKEKTGSFCKNCQNSVMQKDGVGFLLSLEEIFEIIEKKYNFMYDIYNKCEIAIMGGEPLAEINRKFTQEIAKKYDTVVYTWRMPKDLKNIDTSMFKKIVCGEYIEELNVGDDYVLGSTNQIVVDGNLELILEYKKTGDDIE